LIKPIHLKTTHLYRNTKPPHYEYSQPQVSRFIPMKFNMIYPVHILIAILLLFPAFPDSSFNFMRLVLDSIIVSILYFSLHSKVHFYK